LDFYSMLETNKYRIEDQKIRQHPLAYSSLAREVVTGLVASVSVTLLSLGASVEDTMPACELDLTGAVVFVGVGTVGAT